MRWSNEPVLLSVIVAGILAATAGALTVLDTGGTALAAAALWLTQTAIVVGGGTYARSQAWGPRTVDEIMDAEAVVAAAERGEHR